MALYQAHKTDEQTPVQFVGVYTMHWPKVLSGEITEPEVMFSESKVDDELVNAAPTLLAACEAVLRAQYRGEENIENADLIRQLEAAIAKAEGR
jgi:hypothetical protein